MISYLGPPGGGVNPVPLHSKLAIVTGVTAFAVIVHKRNGNSCCGAGQGTPAKGVEPGIGIKRKESLCLI